VPVEEKVQYIQEPIYDSSMKLLTPLMNLLNMKKHKHKERLNILHTLYANETKTFIE
jgi:hypothetical protein